MKPVRPQATKATRDWGRLRGAALIAFLVAPPVFFGAWALIDAFQRVTTTSVLVASAMLIWLIGFCSAITAPRRNASGGRAGALIRRQVSRAMNRGDLELFYQPQIDLRTGRPNGVEALLRWRRGHDIVTPDRFLPAVEKSDLIRPLTVWVLDRAITKAAAWQREGLSINVSVNLSAANLRDTGIAGEIERLLDVRGLRPDLLTLEVTETTVLDEPERARAVLDAIAALGVSISIDDFGIGHSSLLRLSIFPVDEIKIDRSFVGKLPDEGRAFVEGVIRLAGDLSMRVVAEGVESEKVLDELQALGCGSAQGHLFARAIPAADVCSWFRTHNGGGWARHESSITIPPDYDRLGEVRDLIERRATTAGMKESELWDIRVAATEGVANAIEHGTRSEDGLIHVRVAEIRGDLLIEIIGGGREPGSTPEPRKHPGGRGISIMNETMDQVRLTHSHNGNVIRMTKALPPRSEFHDAAAVPLPGKVNGS